MNPLLHNVSLLEQVRALWQDDMRSLKLISKGINEVYRFKSNGRKKILKLTCATKRSCEELASATDYQRHLYENNAPVAKPIQSVHCRYVEAIHAESKQFLVRVTDEAPGQVFQFSHSDKNIYKNWGSALAKLHVAAESYQTRFPYRFISYADLWKESCHYIQFEEEKIKNEYLAITDWFKSVAESGGNYGLNHGDHRIGNVIFNRKTIYIIDFEEPIYHWFVADIARPFLELCENTSFGYKEEFLYYLEGYQIIRSVHKKQLEYIPWCIRMKNLEMYLWAKNNWHHPIAPGGTPTEQWLTNRRKMILELNFIDWFSV